MDAEELALRIRDAAPGARIELPAGRIVGTFTLPRAVTLVGTGATILDADSGGPVVVIEAEGEVRLERLTLTGGRGERGGALHLERGQITLEGCELVTNRALDGGALSVGGDAQAVLRDCWLAQNSAERGGALSVGGGAHLHLERCRFEENQAARRGHHLYTSGTSASRPRIELVDVAFGGVSAEGPSIVNDSDFKAELVLERTPWPTDSERPTAKRVRRRLTLH